nr:MAG TPA: toxin [Caudoviricetes sp.]
MRGAEKRGVSILGLPAEKTKWEFLGAGGFFSSFPFHWGRFDSVHSLTKNR